MTSPIEAMTSPIEATTSPIEATTSLANAAVSTGHDVVPPNKAMLCARKEGEPKAWVRRKG